MFCTNCGSQVSGSFCSSCGTATMSGIPVNRANLEKEDFRKNFALTFVLALGTAVFWLLQSYVPGSGVVSVFGPISGLLSLLARASVVVSFVIRSSNWLAISAIASTSSLVLGLLGAAAYGDYTGESWALTLTWVFSLATLITYFVQARKVGITPYVIQRNK